MTVRSWINRLRSNVPEVRGRAIQDVEKIKQQIKDGKKPDMEDFKQDDHKYDYRTDQPQVEKISSSFEKSELRDSQWLINELGRSPDYRDKFMKWIEKNHVGHGHGHLNPGSREAREALERFRQEEGIKGKRD